MMNQHMTDISTSKTITPCTTMEASMTRLQISICSPVCSKEKRNMRRILTFLLAEVKFRSMSNFEVTRGSRCVLWVLLLLLSFPMLSAEAQVVDVYADEEDDQDQDPNRPDPVPEGKPTPETSPAPVAAPEAPLAAPQQKSSPDKSPVDPDQSDIDRARAHLARGREYYGAGEYAKAAGEFEKAFGARPVPAFQFNAGVAHERDGNFPRAIAHFERYLRLAPNAKDAPAVRERLERLKKGVALAQAAKATDIKSILYVKSEGKAADVTVGHEGQVVVSGKSPVQFEIETAGRYDIEVVFSKDNIVRHGADVTTTKDYVFVANAGGFTGHYEIVTDPSGAEVYINDRAEGSHGHTPLTGNRVSKKYHFWVEKPGFETVEFDMDIVTGELQRKEIKLERVSYGKVRVVSNVRGSAVLVDGEKVGVIEKSALLVEVPAGLHTVSISAEDMKTYEVAIEVRRGKEHRIRVKLLPAVDRSSAWVAGTLAVLLVGGGIVAGVIGNNIKSDLEAERDAGVLRQDDDRIDVGFWMHAGADIAFGLGAVLGAFSVYYFLADPLPESEAEVQEERDFDWVVNPAFGPGFAGASVGGSF